MRLIELKVNHVYIYIYMKKMKKGYLPLPGNNLLHRVAYVLSNKILASSVQLLSVRHLQGSFSRAPGKTALNGYGERMACLVGLVLRVCIMSF